MPTRPRHPCPTCGALIDERCPACAPRHEAQRRAPWITAFYNSTTWKKLRALKRRTNPMCESNGPTCTRIAVDVDHILPLEVNPDLALVWENLQSMCRACHAAKTARRMTARR